MQADMDSVVGKTAKSTAPFWPILAPRVTALLELEPKNLLYLLLVLSLAQTDTQVTKRVICNRG